MRVQDISQGLDTEVTAVVLVRWPRFHGNISYNIDDLLIETKGQTNPLLEYVLGIKRSIPSKLAVRIQILLLLAGGWGADAIRSTYGHSHMTAQPGRIRSSARNTSIATQWSLETLATNNILDL